MKIRSKLNSSFEWDTANYGSPLFWCIRKSTRPEERTSNYWRFPYTLFDPSNVRSSFDKNYRISENITELSISKDTLKPPSEQEEPPQRRVRANSNLTISGTTAYVGQQMKNAFLYKHNPPKDKRIRPNY
ncbi:hypothetical protein V1478_000395 [Vespula squamosa]|uniref:Uncharacterized protein n=1 Tax=Vespula squamosa TaxID=30214 RepID=A0ABD2C5H0_VESSQ